MWYSTSRECGTSISRTTDKNVCRTNPHDPAARAPARAIRRVTLGKPSDFTVDLEQTGALNLKWKNTNPKGATGVVYQLWRRIGSEGEFTYIGGVGDKKYTDGDVPAGSAQVQYQIQAVRSTSVGPFALFIVNFGAGSSGATTASVVEGTPSRRTCRVRNCGFRRRAAGSRPRRWDRSRRI